MSLYTPLFPSSSAMPPRASSSSETYSSRLSKMHLALASLPAELCPPSRPNSPSSDLRTQHLRDAIAKGLESGSYLGDLVRLEFSCRTQPMEPPPAMPNQTLPPGFQYIIAETEEEWFEWEEKVAEARAKMKASKKPSAPVSNRARVPPKSRETIENWQANVVPPSQTSEPIVESPPIADVQDSAPAPEPIVTSKLTFPVVKRASLTMKGKGSQPSGSSQPERPRSPSPPKRLPDLSDSTFLPPTFSNELHTSTPVATKKAEPIPIPPIARKSPPLIVASPASPPLFSQLPDSNASAPARISTPPTPPSPRKRSRPPSPSSANINPNPGPLKKARTEPAIPVTPTRSLTTTVKVWGHGLGNARGFPVPRTPNGEDRTPEKQAGQAATDLLATSRRSKPRVRPPSRHEDGDGEQGTPSKSNDAARLLAASPSGKTYLASPASSSPGTGMPIAAPFEPPSSPLFTQNPTAFAPRMQSSFRFGSNASSSPAIGAASSSNGNLGRTGSFGAGTQMGYYNSQFDVDGQVDRVSAFMEKDVDFSGWLRDEGSEPERGEPEELGTQSQNRVASLVGASSQVDPESQ